MSKFVSTAGGNGSMGNLTYAQLCALSDDEQIRDERVAIMVHDGGLTESEAVAIIEQRQHGRSGNGDFRSRNNSILKPLHDENITAGRSPRKRCIGW